MQAEDESKKAIEVTSDFNILHSNLGNTYVHNFNEDYGLVQTPGKHGLLSKA